jgi:hypothetical protein
MQYFYVKHVFVYIQSMANLLVNFGPFYSRKQSIDLTESLTL